MTSSPDSISVLHVDDDPDLLWKAADGFGGETDRITVHTASSATAGLDELERLPVDCVVSDYDLPGQDGIELLETVREDHPDLPFVLYTAEGSEEVASEAIAEGATDYLQKRDGVEEHQRLANRIVTVVEQHRTQQANAELQRERDRRAALFANATNPVMEVTFDDDTARVTDINPAFEETFRLAADEVADQTVAEVVVPASERAEHEQIKEQVLAGEHVELEVKRETAAGVRDFLLQIIPIEIGGVAHGAYAWYVDITERQDRAAKITALHAVATELEGCQTQSAVYERLVEAAEEVLDYDLAVADAVEGEVLVAQAVSSDIASDEYYEQTPISASDNLGAEAFRTGETSVVADLRTRGVTPAESAYRAVLTVPIGDFGIFQAVATEPGFFNDSDRELAELLCDHAREALADITYQQALQRQNDRLEEFTSVASHDLRSPLGVARGRVELAAEEVDSEHLDAAIGALDRMESLIEDLLRLAREGEDVGDFESVHLGGVADQCWDTVETAEATLMVETERRLWADPGRFRQLLENLMRNAVEHGGDTVTIEIGELDDGFYVADDGPGIPESDRYQVFEAGYSTTDAGTGFGLAIVKEIAIAHGWTVEIPDSESGGTRFEFRGVSVDEQ